LRRNASTIEDIMSATTQWVAGELQSLEAGIDRAKAFVNTDRVSNMGIAASSVIGGVGMVAAATTQVLASGATGAVLAGTLAFAATGMAFTGLAAGAVFGLIGVGFSVIGADAALGSLKKGVHNLAEKLKGKRSEADGVAPIQSPSAQPKL
jgi:hypothetical protein